MRRLGEEVDEADPEGLVVARSRILCAALGALSQASAKALGASPDAAEEIGLAGAALSLLTKLDDEVIDSLAFHGGPNTPRDEVYERTRTFLAPTLAALLGGARGGDRAGIETLELPRERFAFRVGRRLAASRSPHLGHVLEAIELGWEVQARAARVLTAHPRSVTRVEVLEATRSISGAWLGMITQVGELAPGARRPLEPAEVDAIWDWGSFIQRADALCDLEKDQRDGLVSTFVGHEAAIAVGTDARPDLASIYEWVAREGIDRRCVPSLDERARLRSALEELSDVETLLSWIFEMLYGRYLAHPLAARAGQNEEGTSCSAP